MIHLEFADRAESVADGARVCCTAGSACANRAGGRHQKTADGVVQSSLHSRCVGCSNCVLAAPSACPGISQDDQMTKCDMCYDRTSTGKRPMCVTVCPAGAGVRHRQEMEKLRRSGDDAFVFGPQTVRTKVFM